MKGVIIDRGWTRQEIERQMTEIGVDWRGIEIMTDKFQHYIIRLFELTPRQASIIKQEMLARGAEAAVSWQICSMDFGGMAKTGLLLSGTLRQLYQFIAKLKLQPFGLPDLAERIENALDNYRNDRPVLTLAGRSYDWSVKTYVMGIVNITPDSFSGDGLYRDKNFIEAAVEQAMQMVEDGADFLDVGAESTRPGTLMNRGTFPVNGDAARVSAEEEERRLLPVIKELANAVKIPISVDTYKPSVAEKALNLGAAMINDIWGLQSPEDPERRMAKLIGETGVPIIMMHNRSQSGYAHLMREIIDSLAESIEIAQSAGARKEQLIIDPGIGFGKSHQDNLSVLAHLDQLKILGCPVLLGTSRKSVVGLTLDLPVEERLAGSLATVAWGISQGVNIVRVHDVKETVRAVKMCDAIRSAN
jgi:dihydropteroate synthase